MVFPELCLLWEKEEPQSGGNYDIKKLRKNILREQYGEKELCVFFRECRNGKGRMK